LLTIKVGVRLIPEIFYKTTYDYINSKVLYEGGALSISEINFYKYCSSFLRTYLIQIYHNNIFYSSFLEIKFEKEVLNGDSIFLSTLNPFFVAHK